ncbi:MAG: glycosyltransferase family 2 protein [Ignavibacteriae bacterium]|nr:glycosyltransferase family 2 protein [Ignavibacteriota bacterium]
MNPVSVIVIARDEERNIAACLESVAWAAQVIVVVDDRSTDATAELARKSGADVYVRPWLGYAGMKSAALQHASHEWVLWLDADERVLPELAREIDTVLATSPPETAFRVARRAYFLGKWIRHCGWYPGHVTRLFRKSHARFSSSAVHEHLEVDGPIGTLRNDLLHFTDDDLEHYFEKLNRYTSLAAQELVEAGRRVRARDLLLRPWAIFVKMYVLRGGFLDGTHGYLLSRLSAAYVLTKYAKAWQSQRDAGTGS